MMKIRIRFPDGEIIAGLDETPTAKAIARALPFSSSANTWGEEVYFTAPVSVTPEADARQVVDPGTVCFWVQGSALALPYGPTPVSQGDECRLVSKVNVLGKIEGDARQLSRIKDGDRITVEAVA